MLSEESLISNIGKEDSAETFFNKEFNESYHSYVGPIIEAEHKFVHPSNLHELLNQKTEISVLDPFFGLGYNTGILIKEILKVKNNAQVKITAIEKDINPLKKIKDLIVPEDYKNIRDLLGTIYTKRKLEINNIEITLHIDDINNLVCNLKTYDLIYFDPFSHKSTPQFWEDSFLLKMFNLLNAGGKLCTYSSMKKIETLATENNFLIEKISPLGRKKYSLVVVKPT